MYIMFVCKREREVEDDIETCSKKRECNASAPIIDPCPWGSEHFHFLSIFCMASMSEAPRVPWVVWLR